LTSRQHAKKREPKHQRKEKADDAGSAHASDLYSRPSSSSITSTQVVTDGSELTASPRLIAISFKRPWNRRRLASSFGPETSSPCDHCAISWSEGLRLLVFTQAVPRPSHRPIHAAQMPSHRCPGNRPDIYRTQQ